jgi:hypothetical protein
MMTGFFTSSKLLVLNALPNWHKYKQDYFFQKVVPEPKSEKSGFARQKIPLEFAAHMDNSMGTMEEK